nr:MAG TPA: hypothetical protein [Caudoviricetes sp.]
MVLKIFFKKSLQKWVKMLYYIYKAKTIIPSINQKNNKI